jgi:predicted amino acid-binding ACT domain protein
MYGCGIIPYQRTGAISSALAERKVKALNAAQNKIFSFIIIGDKPFGEVDGTRVRRNLESKCIA